MIVSSPHPILHHKVPADPSIGLSFDLHTETFKVMANIPVGDAPHDRITMCTLNDRLCLSEDKGDTQTIWSLNQANMTWHKTYSVQLSLVLKRNILTHGHRSHPFSTTGYCFMIAATTSPRWWYTIIDYIHMVKFSPLNI